MGHPFWSSTLLRTVKEIHFKGANPISPGSETSGPSWTFTTLSSKTNPNGSNWESFSFLLVPSDNPFHIPKKSKQIDFFQMFLSLAKCFTAGSKSKTQICRALSSPGWKRTDCTVRRSKVWRVRCFYKKKVCHAKTKIHLQKQMEGMCMCAQFRHLHNAILAKDSHIAPFPGNVHNLKAQQTTDLSTVFPGFPGLGTPNEAIENYIKIDV